MIHKYMNSTSNVKHTGLQTFAKRDKMGGGNLLPTDKNREGTDPTSKGWGGMGGEDRCSSDITDLQLTKQNKQVPPRDEQERCHDTNELRSHSHDQGDSYWDFYGRRQMDQANVK